MNNKPKDSIIITDAHTNNLKHISLEIPKHSVVVFSGASGSGKSSLLFDTIYTEAQRQLIETFSSFARARLPKLSRPDVEQIRNLSTPIVIDQKKMGSNLRSTVGTATELATYIRLLYSRIGQPFLNLPSFAFSFNHPEGMCPHCHGLGKVAKIDLELFLDKDKSLREGAIRHPFFKQNSYMLKELLHFGLFDGDKPLREWSGEELHKLLFSEPVELAKEQTGLTYKRYHEGIVSKLERTAMERGDDEKNEEEQSARDRFYKFQICPHCLGSRINERARSVKINGVSIDEAFRMEVCDLLEFMRGVQDPMGISQPLIRKIVYVLEQLVRIGVLTCITGVSGCGKSSLIHGCFTPAHPEACVIDQEPVGRTSRGNIVSYMGVFNHIRKLFADSCGCDQSLFSFNAAGACPKCEGRGFLSYEMSFLDAVKTRCDECNGKRYNSLALSHKYRGKDISQILDLTVEQALDFFSDSALIRRHIEILKEVGLGYLTLGQSLSSLSGGECQRLKIATVLKKKGGIYVMDEPTTGLHMDDIDNFFRIVSRLVNAGNTVVIIEHNTDIIRRADWEIELGPEGGKNGGYLLYEGVPRIQTKL